jgi:hypothetical protein
MKRRMVQEDWRNGGSNFTRHCDPEEIERSNLMMEDENHFGSVITPTEGKEKSKLRQGRERLKSN